MGQRRGRVPASDRPTFYPDESVRRASDAYELRNSGQTAEFKVCGVKVEKATATEAAELAAAMRAGDRLQAAG